MSELAGSQGGKACGGQRVWTFGRPIDFHKKSITQVLQASHCGSLLIISGTGSPNSMIAARDLNLPSVYVFLGMVKKHRRSHGEHELVKHFEEAALQAINANGSARAW